MIRSTFLTAFLAMSSCAAMAQAGAVSAKPVPPTANAPQAAAATESAVPENAPVITINGVCEVSPTGVPKSAQHTAAAGKTTTGTAAPASHPDCKTQITRAEFEKLMKTVAAGAPASARRQVANRYVQFLTAANEGVKLGVDKDPDFTEQLALMRLQLLAQDAERKLQSDAAKVSDDDIKAYYDQNPTSFEEVTLTRIFVPRGSAEPASGQAAPDSKAIADDAHQQLVSGGDPEQIQKSIFEKLKNTTPPPSTKFGAKRRGSLPPAHEQKIFSLKQGEVSDVIQDSIGYVIYRVDAKQQVPLEQAKEQVKQRLTQQRIEDARQKIMTASKADYNDAYFGSEASALKPGQPPPPTLKPKAEATPSASPAHTTTTAPAQPANPKK